VPARQQVPVEHSTQVNRDTNVTTGSNATPQRWLDLRGSAEGIFGCPLSAAPRVEAVSKVGRHTSASENPSRGTFSPITCCAGSAEWTLAVMCRRLAQSLAAGLDWLIPEQEELALDHP
jgi:hypothetical protein